MQFVIELSLLLIAQACHEGFGEFYVGDGLKQYSQAVDACRDNHSRLVLPVNGALNQGIQMLLTRPSFTSAWIDLQIAGSGWHDHNTGIMLYDQGCFTNSLKGENNSTNIECYDYCLRKSSTYAAFQQRDGKAVCFCPSHIKVNTSVEENKCNATCRGIDMPLCGTKNYLSYRVLAINGTTDVSPWDTVQTRYRESLQCAAFYGSYVDTTWSHYLRPRHCLENLPSLCSTSGGIQTINEISTWFQAYVSCNGLGGHLLVPNSNQRKLPTWTENQYYWTGITAFKWMSDSISDNNIVYVNWAGGQPNISGGNCVLMNPGGMWKSSRCDVAKPYICESGNFSFEESTSTHIPTDTDVTATNLSTFPPSPTTGFSPTTGAFRSSSPIHTTTDTPPTGPPNNIIMAVVVSLTLIVIISVIVASALLYRKHQLQRRTFRSALSNITYSPDDYDSITGTASATVDSDQFLYINGQSSFGKPNLPSDDVNYVNQGEVEETAVSERKDPPVYANLQ